MAIRLLFFAASLAGAFVAGTMFPTRSTQAQTQQGRLDRGDVAQWLSVAFMKVPADKEADYLRATHQGRHTALVGVAGAKPEWSYVTMNSFARPDAAISYPRAYSALNRQLPYAELMKQTLAAREIMRTERCDLIDSVQ